jgi:hypothetical protein
MSVSVVLAAILAALQALVRGLGLAAARQQLDAGRAEQAAIDLEAGNAVLDKAVAAGDAYDRLSADDRERLRVAAGDYRD